MDILTKFQLLGIDSAPGQESLQKAAVLDLRGEALPGDKVDFSHGDVDAHPPTPGSFELFADGFREGGAQAYTPYRGRREILEHVASSLSAFTGAAIDPAKNLILTPGTQGALFLAMGALIGSGDKVAIIEPDYFANHKLVTFFDGEQVSIPIDWTGTEGKAGIDLAALEEAFKNGVRVFLFSNPNNPTGCVYSKEEICAIAKLAKEYNVALIVDELYARQIYPGVTYTHLCAEDVVPDMLVTITGPSKTESLSGFRLGAAFGTPAIIDRMEKLQAIMSLRCTGYSQAVFKCWFNEPEGWMADRVAAHAAIRNDLMALIERTPGVSARPSDGGSYLFVTMPELSVPIKEFVRAVRELSAVTITPGTEFGPQFTHHFRINYSQDHDRAVAALSRVFAVMERYVK